MPPKHKPPKGSGRAFKSSFTTSTKSSLSKPTKPPPPYTSPTPSLQQFALALDKNYIYITHIDTHPSPFKRKIFLVPLLMNISILILVLYRISYIGPYYLSICRSLMGQKNSMTINTSLTPVADILWEVGRRTGTFMIDLLVYVFIWLPFPWDFFIGRTSQGKGGSPVAWRLSVGFRDEEVVVRRSRKWGFGLGDVLEEGGDGMERIRAVVGKAVDSQWVRAKTGYAMVNTEWDLDWRAMVRATKMVDCGEVPLDEFRTTTWVWGGEELGWMVIESAQAGGSAAEDEGRRKIVLFKEELTAMGKEGLFFRWIELVQYESSRQKEWGDKEKKVMMEKARVLFEGQGVDFDGFWEKIGGMEGMPGMD